MANTVYSNFVLANEAEDQFNSHLDLSKFCTIDRSLVGTAGMKKTINRYTATNGTQKLAKGVGNTSAISIGFTPATYDIVCAQNHFDYYDEEVMTDPFAIVAGTRHCGTDMFNTMNADIYAEMKKTTLTVTANNFVFGDFADAVAKLNLEEEAQIFGFVSPTDLAQVRKSLKDDLKYVEAFVRSGYVGTVCGINLYTKKDATPGTIVIGTKEAVTLFVKKGTEVEQERDANTRENKVFTRKYYVAALTDGTKAVKIS